VLLGSIALTLLGVLATAPARAAAGADATVPACHVLLEQHPWQPPRSLKLDGHSPINLQLQVPKGANLLIVVAERDIDARLEVHTGAGGNLATAESPIRRWGPLRALVASSAGEVLQLRILSKEHPDATGSVIVSVFDAAPAMGADTCRKALHHLAMADEDYSKAQDISFGRAAKQTLPANTLYLSAADGYRGAFSDLDAASDPAFATSAALAVSSVDYYDLKNWSDSARWALRAGALARRQNDEYGDARAQALLAASWIELPPTSRQGAAAETAIVRPDSQVIRSVLGQLVVFHDRRDERYDAALQVNNIGLTWIQDDQFTRAEAVFRDAVARFHRLHEWPREGLALQNIAVCEWGEAKLELAEHDFDAVLEKLRASPNPYLYLIALTNHALVSYELGHFDQALRLEEEALTLSERLQAPLRIAQNLYALGVTYYALGDRDLSRDYLERSEKLKVSDSYVRVETLRALATVYRDAGRFDDAHRLGDEALSLANAPTARARISVGIAMDTAALGDPKAALSLLQSVLRQTSNDPIGAVQALIARARIERSQHLLALAQTDLERARQRLHALEDPEDEFQADVELAQVHADRDARGRALSMIDQAIGIAEVLRRQTANPELRAQRQEPLRRAYELKIDWLLEPRTHDSPSTDRSPNAREVIEALTTAETSRAHTLADFAAANWERVSDQRLEPLLQRQTSLYRDITASRVQLEALRASAGETDERVRRLRAGIAALRRELDMVNTDLTREAGSSSHTIRPEPEHWVEALAARAPDTLMVEYWLGEDSAYAWTISGNGIRLFPLGPSAAIAEAAHAVHDSLRGFASVSFEERQKAVAALYARVLAPLGPELHRYRSFVAIPDRTLVFVPFAALGPLQGPDNAYVIAQQDVAVAPAAWWLFEGPRRLRPPVSNRILIVADPVYESTDPRVPPGARDFRSPRQRELARLPWTAREADMISRPFPPAAVDRLEGLSATRERFMSADLAAYRYVHIAAHAEMDAGMPQLSALILGAYDEHGPVEDQAVRAADLLNRTFRADMVVLSACDTAVGKEFSGEGAMSLAYAALARGAQSVVASFWEAPDEMSSRIMTDMYRGLLQDHATVPGALGAAMRAVLRRDRTSDPALWAAFQPLLGSLAETQPVVFN
jgi:CHAT domain-containing protein/tetratricopeptide (TPR) repeat protein